MVIARQFGKITVLRALIDTILATIAILYLESLSKLWSLEKRQNNFKGGTIFSL